MVLEFATPGRFRTVGLGAHREPPAAIHASTVAGLHRGIRLIEASGFGNLPELQRRSRVRSEMLMAWMISRLPQSS